MNKYLKHMLCLVLLGYIGTTIANDSNPNSAGYHARHNPTSPYYVGSNQQPAAPPQPTGEWKEAWGAVATDNTIGVIGAVTNSTDRKKAETDALVECRAKGGTSCKIDLLYANQCGVMVLGAQKFRMRAAESIEEATRIGMKECQANDTNCRVYYSACSKPEFIKY